MNFHNTDFIGEIRGAFPYIRAHAHKTFVVGFGGSLLENPDFGRLIQDLSLLSTLGVRLVVVCGIGPQIDAKILARFGVGALKASWRGSQRVTSKELLPCIREAVGEVRCIFEAQASLRLVDNAMAQPPVPISSANVITAKPLGVIGGIDHGYTGLVRHIAVDVVERHLDQGGIFLQLPVGYSPSGDLFNLNWLSVSEALAVELKADKLLLLTESSLSESLPVSSINWRQQDLKSVLADHLDPVQSLYLETLVHVCKKGVPRGHLVHESVLLQELFSRDGCGLLVDGGEYERIRLAAIDDISGILALLEPLEASGVLVSRTEPFLETRIDSFAVIELDGLVIGCVSFEALDGSVNDAELSCLVVHPAYQRKGRAQMLLDHVVNLAKSKKFSRLFVLSTQTVDWFKERHFNLSTPSELPFSRQKIYENNGRQSQVLIRKL
jgi:amino-acid N-acetyltransferase